VHQDTDTEAMVYVRLLNESTDVWRLVRATALPDGTFRLLQPNGYDANAETREFSHPQRCVALLRKFTDGDEASSRSHVPDRKIEMRGLPRPSNAGTGAKTLISVKAAPRERASVDSRNVGRILRLARGPARDIRQPAWHNRPDLIKAPAISAAVRSVLLFHRRADALGKCLSARLIAFDDALIFVSKSNGPPRPPGLRISGNRFRSVYGLRSRLLRWRGARQQ
jgi:hypothetical protein